MQEKINVVAIDGPAGVGKSTISKEIAHKLGYLYLDTGAMYRAVGFHLQKQHIKAIEENTAEISAELNVLNLSLFPAKKAVEGMRVQINGEDISSIIRTPEVALLASATSKLAVVRDFLTKQQREYGKQGKIVAEGRDMGTVVFPGAAWKFYLDARPEVRTRRRFDQLVQQGKLDNNEAEFTKLLNEIQMRDKQDKERKIAPLQQADDAILIDTSDKTAAEVLSAILKKI